MPFTADPAYGGPDGGEAPPASIAVGGESPVGVALPPRSAVVYSNTSP